MLRLLKKLMNIVINIFEGACYKRKRAATIGFKFGLPKLKTKGNGMPAEASITTEQKIPVVLKIVTDTGKPAKVDGAPAWVVISGNSSVVVAEDGLSAEVISADDPGDTTVMVKADADLGEGVEEISDTFTVHVVGATAKNLGLSFGTPVPKDAAPPI